MDDPSWRRALPFDVAAALGLVVFLASLTMTWVTTRTCPLFEECGPWVDRDGWSEFGTRAVVGLASAAVLYAALPHAVLRRALPALAVAGVSVLLSLYIQWADFVIFGDAYTHGLPLSLATAGLTVAFGCLCAGAVSAAWATPPARPTAANP